MNTFAVEIWDDESLHCTFYSVLKEGHEKSETDKFFERFEDHDKYEDSANLLLSLIINDIGGKYGAIDDFFDRNEQKAQALPPKPKNRVKEIKILGINFPLRLYCLRINENIVVLFNGGIKESDTAQNSEDLRFKFYESQSFAEKIIDAIDEGMITIEDSYLKDFTGSTEIIL